MKTSILLLLYFLITTTYPVFATDWYVRPAGGNYGSENGTSYANALDGLKNVVWGEGGVQAGDTLYVCGLHYWTMTSTQNNVTQADITLVSGSLAEFRVGQSQNSFFPSSCWCISIPDLKPSFW